MRKLLNNPRFVIAMCILAGVLAWTSLKKEPLPTGNGQVESSDAGFEQALPGGSAASLPPAEALRQLAAARTQRDPFASRAAAPATAVETVESPDQLDTARLAAVWTQNGRTLCIINDRIAEVGESFGRLTVESAGHDGVWLSHWKGRDFLAVGGSFTLRTPAHPEPRASTH